MKLQINSLEALERLIGGDTEVEIEIRNNIVQEFAKKHLKAIANETVIGKVAEDVRAASQEISRQATTEALNKTGMFTGQSWNQTFALLPEVKTALRDAALNEVRAAINEAVQDAVKRYDDVDGITRRINTAINNNIESKIKEGVKLRLQEITSKVLA